MIIKNNGNVGIGTTSPGITMDINGYMARKVWRVHGASTDQSDTGYLSGRSLSITKYKSATHLRVGHFWQLIDTIKTPQNIITKYLGLSLA